MTTMMVRNLWLLALTLVLSACATHFDTSIRKGVDGYTIYRLRQEQAFAIAYDSIATHFPGRNISKIDGPAKGYSTWSRFGLDTYTQQVLVIPARGITKDGMTVEGFYLEISGSGSSGSGRAKNVSLHRAIQRTLDQQNVSTVVTRIERTSYTDPVFGTKTSSSASPPQHTVEERLQKLESLFDRGLISEHEYKEGRANVIQSL